MSNSSIDKASSVDSNGSENSDLDDEKFADYLLDKPLSTREYFKLLFYFVVVVVVGVLIAVLVFVVNK